MLMQIYKAHGETKLFKRVLCFVLLIFTLLLTGRVSYQSEAPREHFGSRSFGRGSGQDGGEREYNKPTGNGFFLDLMALLTALTF